MAKLWTLRYVQELAGTFLLPLVIILLCLPLRDWISPTDVAMLQLLWVAWQAQQYGWRWASLTTLVSVLVLNWCFVPPYYTFDVHDASFLISFVVMVLLGLLISLLSDRSKQQVKRLRYAMSQTRGMYMLAKGLGQRQDWQKQCAYTAKLLSRRLGASVQLVAGPQPQVTTEQALLAVGSPAVAWIVVPECFLSSHPTLLHTAQSLLAQSYARLELSEKAQQDRVKAQLEQQKAMLLRSLSHDLRTPLATIMGASSMLADPQLQLSTEQRQQQAQNIYQQSQILNQHFEKVLELSKAQLSTHRIQHCDFSSDDLVAGALARRGDQAAELSTYLICNAATPLKGDLELLEIALANMLENALRYGAAPFELTIGQTASHCFVRLSNGLKSVAPAARDKGHGLGLNICQAVAALHQGKFELHTDSTSEKVTAVLEWPLC
jgi:two-component system sensor histidine kinase KdpD